MFARKRVTDNYPKQQRKNLPDFLNDPLLDKLIDLALAEDLGEEGDITSDSVVSGTSYCLASITSKSAGILAGLLITEKVYGKIDGSVKIKFLKKDGDKIKPGEEIAVVSGSTWSVLAGERTVLNFIQHLSGVATLTRKYVDAVSGTNAEIFDTRKTTPGMRAAEKYAVSLGGGRNHRFGLYDQILIKDNHLKAAAGVKEAVRAAKKRGFKPVEVEAETLDQLSEALEGGADIILLDNMDLDTIGRAVRIAAGSATLESSGGIDLSTVRRIAETGVDRISVGAVTSNAEPLDLALDISETRGEPY